MALAGYAPQNGVQNGRDPPKALAATKRLGFHPGARSDEPNPVRHRDLRSGAKKASNREDEARRLWLAGLGHYGQTKFLNICFLKSGIHAMMFDWGNLKSPQLTAAADAPAKEKKFFIWIRCNPLKSPDSTKGIQGNPSFFI